MEELTELNSLPEFIIDLIKSAIGKHLNETDAVLCRNALYYYNITGKADIISCIERKDGWKKKAALLKERIELMEKGDNK